MTTEFAILAAGHDPKDHVIPHALARIFNSNIRLPLFKDQAPEFWFTNHLLMTLVAAVVTLLVFTLVGLRYRGAIAGLPIERPVARGFTGLVEALMDGLRTGVVRPVLGANTDRFMPFLWTVFFFILVNNLLGMIPLAAIFKITLHREHLGGTATGNVNVTAGLAICAFLAIHVSGVAELFKALVDGTHGHHGHDDGRHEDADHSASLHAGAHHAHAAGGMSPVVAAVSAPALYLWNFAPHVFKPGPEISGVTRSLLWLADIPMWAFLLLLEFIGAAVKPFALCMRLFANMIAGHIVLASILLLIPVFQGFSAAYIGVSIPVVIGCTLLSCLELFVCFLQAYIFMFLTTMFIGAAVHPEH